MNQSVWGTFAHDWRLMMVAGLLALLAGLAAIRLFHRALHSTGSGRNVAVVLAAITLGCGVWSAHFAGMLGYQPGLVVGYDATLIFLSLFIATLVAGAGLAGAIYYPTWTLLGGALVGIGIGGMHYIAVRSLHVPGHVASITLLSAVSVGVAMVFSMAAFYVAVQRETWHWTAGAVGLLALAVVAQHMLAMGGIELIPDPTRVAETFSVSPTGLAVAIASTTAFVGVIGGFGHGDVHSTKLNAALDNLHVGLLIFDSNERILVCNKPYQKMYDVPAEVVQPGYGSLTSLLRYRTGNGSFREDPKQYLINLRKSLEDGSSTHREPKLVDGRIVSVSTHPMAGGGWVAIHENISDRKHAEEQRLALAARDQRRVALEEAISLFRSRAEQMLQTMMESTEAMNTIASALLKTSARTSESAKSALDSSHEASAGTATAAAAAQELTVSIAEINRQLRHTAEAVGVAVSKADKSDTEIAALAEAGQKIGDVIKLIQHIASQIKLLALNATIEAARAGAAGRGFSVVASEVKSLSVQTESATDDIARQITTVQVSTENAIEAIRTITKQVQEINIYSSEAAASVARQSAATHEISQSVAGASEGAKTAFSVLNQVAADATATSDSARAVLQASDAVAAGAVSLREEINSFLLKVSEKANESLNPQTALVGG
jgi:methyl-accepting chemotaxis protein/NO-binding membrane sensor protein with MHYT domain